MVRSLFCLILMIGFYTPLVPVQADVIDKEDHHALVVYTNDRSEVDEYQRSLDMLIGHFTDDIQFVSSNEFKASDLEGITHLFYQGNEEVHLSVNFRKALESFEGTMIAFGENVEQLGKRYSFAEPLDERNYTEMYLSAEPDNKIKVPIQNVIPITPIKHSKVYAWAKGGDLLHPLITRYEDQ